MFIDNLHSYVKTDKKIVQGIQNPATNDRAKMIKENLTYILTNYDKARRLPVGSKRPR